MMTKKQSLAYRLINLSNLVLRAASLILAITGAFRFIGTLRVHALWQERGYASWVIPYLFFAAFLYIAAGITAFLSLRYTPPRWQLITSLCTGLAIALYWIERLLLWSPAQRGGNLPFVALIHLLWLAVLWLATRQYKKETNNVQGNRS
jgi:hypothetical protein